MYVFEWKLAFVVLIGGLVQEALSFPNLFGYIKPSSKVGERLKKYVPKGSSNYKGYPHEYGFGHYYQGDILRRPQQLGRAASISPYYNNKWPEGIVPYVIEANFTDSENKLLQDAFDQFANNTCVRFVPHTNEEFYLTIRNRDDGCVGQLGLATVNDANIVNLQSPECFWSVSTPVHELMHILGFDHEVSRPDRDEYVKVNLNNIRPELQNQFNFASYAKSSKKWARTYGVPYNYGSVMHYSRYGNSIGLCCPVIENIKPYIGDFGSDTGLTPLDIDLVNAHYCNE